MTHSFYKENLIIFYIYLDLQIKGMSLILWHFHKFSIYFVPFSKLFVTLYISIRRNDKQIISPSLTLWGLSMVTLYLFFHASPTFEWVGYILQPFFQSFKFFGNLLWCLIFVQLLLFPHKFIKQHNILDNGYDIHMDTRVVGQF